MSTTSRGAVNGAPDPTGRVHRRTAVLVTVLVHLLLVLLVMPPPPQIAMSMPQGGPSGSMQVTLLDETVSPPPPEPQPIVRKPVPRKRPKTPRAMVNVPPTPIAQATMPMPPPATDTSDTPTVPPTAPEPPDAPRETVARPAHVWGQAPGMPTDNAARANAALAAKLGSDRGSSNTAPPTGPDMEMDGFHVYYDLFNENRLRDWRKQGMTELFLPLPGTLRLMVCPLEVALRRGSGKCHMVDMDSPALKTIGDAREVINIQRVYQLGEVVWSGPGPYH